MIFKKKYFVLTFILFFFFRSEGQKLILNYHLADSIKNIEAPIIPKQKKLNTFEEIISETKQLKSQLEIAGYYHSEIDLKLEKGSSYNANIKLGKRVNNFLLKINNENENPPFLSKKESLFILSKDIPELFKKITSYYDTKGASFTEVFLSNLSVSNDTINGILNIQPSTERTLDKVLFQNYPNFPKNYLKQYLKIRPKETFQLQQIEKTKKLLNNLDFIQQIRNPELLFTNDSTYLYIYVQKKKTNRFDGLVGFSNNDGNNKIRFNGYLDLLLKNTLNKGETFQLYWNNNGNDQQHLTLKTILPFVFKSPITTEINFNIHKQDSSFLNIKSNLLAKYAINNLNNIGISTGMEMSTNLLTLKNPSIISYNKNEYGMLYEFQKPNENKNFSGTTISSSFFLAKKNTENTNENQIRLHLNLENSFTLAKRSQIFAKNETAHLQGTSLFFNELYQLGGANSIRGFNEKSLFASSYNYSNIEYRYLTAQESFLYLLTDFGFLKNTIDKTNTNLLGIGLGYAYKTDSGFINLNYSIGKTNQSTFDFNKGIFHIKVTTSF